MSKIIDFFKNLFVRSKWETIREINISESSTYYDIDGTLRFRPNVNENNIIGKSFILKDQFGNIKHVKVRY
jgi:ACT domain-containing protein